MLLASIERYEMKTASYQIFQFLLIGSLSLHVNSTRAQLFKADPKKQATTAAEQLVKSWDRDCSLHLLNGSYEVIKMKWPGLERKNFITGDAYKLLEQMTALGYYSLVFKAGSDGFGKIGQVEISPGPKGKALHDQCTEPNKLSGSRYKVFSPAKFSPEKVVDIDMFKAGIDDYAVVSIKYSAEDNSQFRQDFCRVYRASGSFCDLGKQRKARILLKADKFNETSPWRVVVSDYGALDKDFLSARVPEEVSKIKLMNGGK